MFRDPPPDVVPALLYKATEKGNLQARMCSRRNGMVDLIKKHLQALATFTEQQLEEALDVDEVDIQAAGGEDMKSVEGQGSAIGDDEKKEEEEVADNDIAENASDDATDELMRSKRYILARGRKVHDAGMQTGVLGGKRVK